MVIAGLGERGVRCAATVNFGSEPALLVYCSACCNSASLQTSWRVWRPLQEIWRSMSNRKEDKSVTELESGRAAEIGGVRVEATLLAQLRSKHAEVIKIVSARVRSPWTLVRLMPRARAQRADGTVPIVGAKDTRRQTAGMRPRPDAVATQVKAREPRTGRHVRNLGATITPKTLVNRQRESSALNVVDRTSRQRAHSVPLWRVWSSRSWKKL